MTDVITATSSYTALVEDAMRAPSSHNSQPWLFRAREGALELHADRTRALPVNDPRDRELLISCGAALTNLLASAEHHHFSGLVHLWPDDEDPDHLATVSLVPTQPYTDARLAYGIRLRGTWRRPFPARQVTQDVVDQLLAAARDAGAWAHVVDDEQRPELVDLVTGGDHFQFTDPRWRRELAAWMHPGRSGDGLTLPLVSGAVTRLVVSHVDVGERTARQDAALTAAAPLLVVLGTDTDDEAAWLTAGRALQRLLLTGAVLGIQAGYSNQPCQVDVLRPILASVIGRKHPQMVLRLGYPGETPPPTPRRPLSDVLLA